MNEKIVPYVWGNCGIKTIAETGLSVAQWQDEVHTSDGHNNDMPTQNSLIISPWHKLKINGVEVPVYSSRCGLGTHSFARIDVDDDEPGLSFEIELENNDSPAECIVLPRSRNAAVTLEENKVKANAKGCASYTFVFCRNHGEPADPGFMPLTVMVTKENKCPDMTSDGYNTVYIEPGYHNNDELKFSEENTVYVFRKGLHEISSVSVPSNSVLYIEHGAYLMVSDRKNEDGNWNTDTALHTEHTENVRIICHGIIDCGEVLGGDFKHKHVFNCGGCKNVTVDGLNVINSNTWSVCFYDSENITVENCMLLGYRTYSDGIMMSECRNSAGRYNFVRTGDDAIEFKGTGWQGKNIGENCIYEYNDCWTDKGAGYCLTWECSCEMRNMVFRNNSLGFAQPVWTDRNTALDCLLGTDRTTRWGDVLFENTEIYRVISPNVIDVMLSADGAKLENITFRNTFAEVIDDGVYAVRMINISAGGTIKNIAVDNLVVNGRRITAEDKNDSSVMSIQTKELADELTVL